MRRFCLIVALVYLIFSNGIAQIRLNYLQIGAREVYEMRGTDILVVDTLVLLDSSRILLNMSKKDNFIHVRQLVVGRGSQIVGKGLPGTRGAAGAEPSSLPAGPCKDGASGQSGKPGTHGTDAVNLFLYVDDLRFKGSLLIDLAGGDGGDGGKGGKGSDGNPGTKLCQGGSGGKGGTGGAGGNGGRAGNLTITSRYGSDLRSQMGEQIIVRSFGGFAGLGGEGGLPGLAGLGPIRDGDTGQKGEAGAGGIPGKPGAVFFQRK